MHAARNAIGCQRGNLVFERFGLGQLSLQIGDLAALSVNANRGVDVGFFVGRVFAAFLLAPILQSRHFGQLRRDRLAQLLRFHALSPSKKLPGSQQKKA